ncbi:MAG: rod-binding protein [Pseudomonadota bacterium]
MSILIGPAGTSVSALGVVEESASRHALHPSGAAAAAPTAATDVAMQFEAAFFAEMLRHSGLGEMKGMMSGGAGEAQFAPMFVEEVAKEIARSKPLGIADMIAARLRASEGGA